MEDDPNHATTAEAMWGSILRMRLARNLAVSGRGRRKSSYISCFVAIELQAQGVWDDNFFSSESSIVTSTVPLLEHCHLVRKVGRGWFFFWRKLKRAGRVYGNGPKTWNVENSKGFLRGGGLGTYRISDAIAQSGGGTQA